MKVRVHGVLCGVSQVFLVGNAAAGVIFLVALLVNSIWAAVFALAASTLAFAVALVLGAEPSAVIAGLYGLSPVLTAVAVGTVFYTPQPRVAVYATAATLLAIIAQAALNVALVPFGIPTLTAPFVAAAWLFLLPRRHFTPVPHMKGRGGLAHRD